MADLDTIVDEVILITGVAENKRSVVRSSASQSCQFLLTNWDWPFLRGSDTDVSVEDQSVYEIRGADDECGVLRSVKYNTVPLDFLTIRQFDMKVAEYGSFNPSVSWWTRAGISTEGFPKIQLFGVPAAAGLVISVRYQKKVTPANCFGLLPENLVEAVKFELLAQYHADSYSRSVYAKMARDKTSQAFWMERDSDDIEMANLISKDKREKNALINLYSGGIRRGRYFYGSGD